MLADKAAHINSCPCKGDFNENIVQQKVSTLRPGISLLVGVCTVYCTIFISDAELTYCSDEFGLKFSKLS